MSNTSDRAYFLETIKNEPLTVSEIVLRFGCSTGTARNWVKHEEVEKVAGSWPTAYTRKDSIIPIKAPTAKSRPDVIIYEIPEPSTEEKEHFFRKTLANEVSFDFVAEFRAADSQKELRALQNKLKSALVVTDYYIGLMKRDGLE